MSESHDRQQTVPAELGEPLIALFAQVGVSAESLDPQTLRLKAVPLGGQFSKPRTNLLLRRSVPAGRSTVFLDSDLAYHGTDPAVGAALAGPCHGNWRQLSIPSVPGAPGEALASVLDFLGSPLASSVRAALGLPPATRSEGQHSEMGRLLTASGEMIDPEQASAAFEASFRQDLAEQLAVLTTRPAPPRSAVLCGPPGSGRDHLMLATAHLLLDSGRVAHVFRVQSARAAAGCLFPAELDSALMRLLDEAVRLDGWLFLVRDLDLLLSGSHVGLALLCEALDRGLRLLATVRSESALGWLGGDEALRRRLAFVPVEPPAAEEVFNTLSRFAAGSKIPVDPTTLQTVMHLVKKQDAADPAAALSLLGAAMAEAAWHNSPQVGPDDVFAVRRLFGPPSAGKE